MDKNTDIKDGDAKRPKDGADDKGPTVGLIELVNIIKSVEPVLIVSIFSSSSPPPWTPS